MGTRPNHNLTRIGPLMIEADNLAEMRQLAEAHDRSLAAEFRQACRHYVRAHRQRQTGQNPTPNTHVNIRPA